MTPMTSRAFAITGTVTAAVNISHRLKVPVVARIIAAAPKSGSVPIIASMPYS